VVLVIVRISRPRRAHARAGLWPAAPSARTVAQRWALFVLRCSVSPV